MKHLILILTMMTLVACGEEAPKAPNTNVEFEYYTSIVRDAYPMAIPPNYTNVPFIFDEELEHPTIAVCRTYDGGKPVYMAFSPEKWETGSDAFRLAVVAHELLHCEYSLGHVKVPYDSKSKMMSPYGYDSLACIHNNGLEYCIDEAIEMGRLGQLESH